MPSNVYFIDMRAKYKENFVDKLGKLLESAGLDHAVKKRGLTAVKLHFGEIGNTAYIRPVFIRKAVECTRKAGGVPFLTDANTLYAGNRSDAPQHLVAAVQNGFAYSVVVAPKVKTKDCVGCGECVEHCPAKAIALAEDKALISGDKCIGCGECVIVCPNEAIKIQWNESVPLFLEKMVEYTPGVLKGKKGRSLFVNFITDTRKSSGPSNSTMLKHSNWAPAIMYWRRFSLSDQPPAAQMVPGARYPV
ncbi:MAG: 4Fe-4S binding protein [Desulfobacterales bacterium]|jgi:uncharacterized Fe-S center protein